MRGVGVFAPASVTVDLIGGFALSIDGAPVEAGWRLRKAKTLVKLLALAPGHRMHRDVLIEQLWPDLEPSAAANNFHQALHAARKAMGTERLALRDDVVLLCPDDGLSVDLEAFEAAAAEARLSDDVDELAAALALASGELLPEEGYAEWVEQHRDRLRRVREALTVQLAVRLVTDERADEAVELISPLADDNPLDEPLQVALIEALAATGRRWDAIATYEQLRDALEADMAATPSAETKAVYRALLGAGAAPAVTVPHNLPASSTSFVGRERTLSELTKLLDRVRLVTLTGPGGAGKSRLGLELARRQLSPGEYPDGVWLVELAGLTDDKLVASSTATAIGAQLAADRPPAVALADQLADRRALLLVDNCEHLLETCADLVATLLARCPRLVVMTTSREPLGLPGELTWRVPSLELPAIDGDPSVEEIARLEAVQLFVERAREAVPAFRLDESNATAISAICFRLDGIPLALELAAARLPHLSVHQLAERLADALVVLASRGRGRLDRQQTMAATLDWSYELLDGEERVLFRRLAVFAGGFDVDAASNVCGEDVRDLTDVLARLVDKSLILADTTAEFARYRLLEVVRQYAEGRLAAVGELARLRRRHREWYVERAHVHDPDRTGPVVGEPSSWFDVEEDNLRVALSSALLEDSPRALQLATAAWRFWMSRGQLADGERWLTQALDGCSEVSLLRARALFARSVLMIRQGRSEPLFAIADEIAAIHRALGDGAEVPRGVHERSVLLYMAAGGTTAEPLLEETLAVSRGLPSVCASAHHFFGIVRIGRSEVSEARRLYDTAAALLDDVPNTAAPFFIGATASWIVDDRSEMALAFGEETMLLGRRVGTEQARAYVTASIAVCERLSGQVSDASALLEDALTRFRKIGDRYGEAYALSQRGHTFRWGGELDAALGSFEEAEQIRRDLRDQRAIAVALSGRALVEAELGRADTARRCATQATSMMDRSRDGAGLAIVLTNAAVVEIWLGAPHDAISHLKRALTNQTIPGGHRAVGWHLLLLADLQHQLGDDRTATESAGAALAMFTTLGDDHGIEVLQRACKAGRFNLPSNQTAEEQT